MLATLILGIAAGAGAPYAEEHVKKALESVLLAEAPMSAMELRMFTFAICLVAAALLAAVFGSGSGIVLAIGAALGVFGPRIIARVPKRDAPDYGEDV
ncbi:MAG: hypothetical protein AAFO80_10760 [Pseudomonadota bacterium]